MTAGERLREAIDREPRLARALLDVIPDLVFRLKRDGTFLDYLPARGLPTFLPAESFLGRNVRDVFPSFADAALEKVALALDTKREQTLEYELPIGDARGVFESRYVYYSDDEVIAIVRDITEKRATAEKLRQSEERFRMLVEVAGDVILLLSPEGEILELNREAERVYGRSSSLLGTSFYELAVSDEERDAARAAAARVLEGAPSRGFPLSVERPDESKRVLSWNVERILDASGEPVGLVACGHDVTEQRALEESVLSIARGVSAATGSRFFRHLARRLAEILGADIVMIGALAGESPERVRTVVLFEDGRLARNVTYPLTGSPCEKVVGRRVCSYPSGVAERFPEDAALANKGIEGYVGAPLHDSKDRALGLINVLYRREVPNVQLAESVLRIFATRAAGELEREQAAEERRSLEAQVQHAQKLESLGILAGGIAHDFNNLLTGILGNVSLALAQLPEDSPTLVNLHRVERAAERAAELTHQMLAYAGRASFVVGALSVNAVVRDLVPLLASSVRKSARVDYDLDPALPDIEADRSQLEQVLMNLITNASDALEEEEGGRIVIRTGTTRADDATVRVFVEVSDTGSGMDASTRERIFDPFFTTKLAGRGLGLAAVQGIVRGHGGDIRVESRLGEGTRFEVLFPVAPATARPARPTPPAAARAVGFGTVLVIDDEEAVRDVAIAALESAGYDVLAAADGVEGVAAFGRHQSDIVAVVLDASMPRLSGEEALARIRALAADVPVLVTSGYTAREAVARFEGAGVEGFIQKPFRAARLVEEVQRLAHARLPGASGKSTRAQA